ncbi:MAG: TPM domain-containing protein [Rikenellaceae bacterium]
MKIDIRRAVLLFALLFVTFGVVVARDYSVAEIPNVQLKSRYNFVSNPDGILSESAVARIDSICYALKVSNIAQIAVVAVDQIVVDGSKQVADPFEFAYKLFSEWGVGREGRDNGLGILLVGDQRQIRFVTGRGVEGVLPDAICKRIQTQYMLPYFRQGDYSAGMVSGVRVVESLLVRSELNVGGSDYYPEAGSAGGGLSFVSILIILGCVIGLPMIFSMISYYRNSKCPKCGKMGYHAVSERIVQRGDSFNLVDYTYRCPHCGGDEHRIVRKLRDDINQSLAGGVIIGGGYGSARGFRRGGFGGGGGSFGGGFGGGSFGGGGAGSGW